MEKDKNYFENKFKDFESVPPLAAWNKIESGLNKKASRKKAIFFLRIAAGLVLLITALWLNWPKLNEQDNTLAKQNANTIEKSEMENQSNAENQQIAAIDSEDQRKLINTPQNESIEEKEKVSVPISEVEKQKNDLPKVESKKGEKHKEVKKVNPGVKEELKEFVETIDIIDTKPLLANNEIESTDIIQSPMHSELLAENNTIENKEEDLENEDNSKSIVIILRPKSNESALASNTIDEEESTRLEKFKEAFINDLYKQKIRIGEVPDLALNKFKLKSN